MAQKLALLSFSLAMSIQASTQALPLNSIFHISKSQNGNQVHYGAKTKSNCSFQGEQPIYPYWLMEDQTIEELLKIEIPAFGIGEQTTSNNKVIFEINGFQRRGISRPITIQSIRGEDGQCKISAYGNISGKEVQLKKIHIDMDSRTFFGIVVGGSVNSVNIYGNSGEYEEIRCTQKCDF